MLNRSKISKIKIDNYYINLNKSINLLYFKELFNTSGFVIYFSYNKLSNRDLYNLKNEILKIGLKSYVANSAFIKKAFDESFQYLNSNVFFIFCNKLLHFIFISKFLNNTNFFCVFNKCISQASNKSIFPLFNSNLNFIHFILFKLLFNILILLLFYVVSLIKSLKIKK